MQNRQFSRLQLTYLIGSLVAALCLLLYFFYPASESQYSTSTKTLRFNYTLTNGSGEFITNSDFSVNIPMELDGIQNVSSISSSHNNVLRKGKSGEQSINFSVDNVAPYASKIINLTLVVSTSDKPKYERINRADYLNTEKYIDLDSSAIKTLASQLRGSSSNETARNIYEWLVNNVTSSSYTADSKGARYLIEKRSGDCTEIMYAFIALARANGIPARGISGFWIPVESTIINAADYHDWAEFYDGKRWVTVDANKGVFDVNEVNYLIINFFNTRKKTGIRFSVSEESLSVGF